MEYGKWLIDSAVKMCDPPSRYAMVKRLRAEGLGITEQSLSAFFAGKRPFAVEWAAPIARLAGVDSGEAVLRVLAERAQAKKPPTKMAGFARMSGLGYTMFAGLGVSLTPDLLTQAKAWIDCLRIVSTKRTYLLTRFSTSVPLRHAPL